MDYTLIFERAHSYLERKTLIIGYFGLQNYDFYFIYNV